MRQSSEAHQGNDASDNLSEVRRGSERREIETMHKRNENITTYENARESSAKAPYAQKHHNINVKSADAHNENHP